MANVALARALAGEPTYPLARLLAQALAGCVPPRGAARDDRGGAEPASARRPG